MQPVGQLADDPAGDPIAPVGERWRCDRLTHDHHHLHRWGNLPTLRHRPLCAPDPNRHDRDLGPARHIGRAVEELLHHGSRLARALREHDERFSPLDHLHAGPQRRSVGRAPLDREAARGGEHPSSETALPERLLAHVAQPTTGDSRDQRRVQVRPVHRSDDERALDGHVVTALHARSEVQPCHRLRHHPEEPVEGPLESRQLFAAVMSLRDDQLTVRRSRRRFGKRIAAHPRRSRIRSTTSSMPSELVSRTTASGASRSGSSSRPWSSASLRARSLATVS